METLNVGLYKSDRYTCFTEKNFSTQGELSSLAYK